MLDTTTDPAGADVVAVILQAVLQVAPGVDPVAMAAVEKQVRERFGGERHYVNRRAKTLTPAKRQAIYQDGLTTMDEADITAKHQVSRRTLYRIMKEGGGRFA